MGWMFGRMDVLMNGKVEWMDEWMGWVDRWR